MARSLAIIFYPPLITIRAAIPGYRLARDWDKIIAAAFWLDTAVLLALRFRDQSQSTMDFFGRPALSVRIYSDSDAENFPHTIYGPLERIGLALSAPVILWTILF